MKDNGNFTIVENGKAAKIYVDPKGADYNGLSLVAQSFAKDVFLVSDIMPEIVADVSQLEGIAVIAGSIGNNDIIDTLIKEGKIDVSPIKHKWECYRIQVVVNPVPTIDKAIIIVGSDKRGTIYGIYHVSELMGVSPWVYWGDVIPVKQKDLVLPEIKLDKVSKEPSVKYRGFFLNDEWPSLGTWVTNKFGDFNEEFYDKVFELILRLKGNYLWPAMWSAIFSENGKKCNTANAQLADAYGVVMGTSHHEGMFCAGEEWQKNYMKYGTSNQWDFASNREAITKFWEDAVKRNKDFESLITLDMRGERDSALGGDLQQNINLLKDIITTQKGLLKKYGIADVPQVLTVYKEVELFWHGTDEIPGLKTWDVLNDVTIMLAEDNFGNLRTLPEPEERNRKAGWGMYYHVDYHGGPNSYEWVNTMPIEKTWEQMSMAYDYGIRNVWILNVGDLKPVEFPLSYFIDLAYDFETWGTNGINKTKEYTRRWIDQQFGKVADKDTLDGIAKVLSGYTRMNGIRKPEVLTSTTFHVTNYNEARIVLENAIALENEAKKYHALIPESFKDIYYQLVMYPAVASANIVKMQIYAGLNQYYYKLGSLLANQYAKLVEETINIDEQMQKFYNDTMSNGKWQGIMSSAHIGYTNWDSQGWKYPEINYVTPVSGALMIIDVEEKEEGHTSGTTILPTFTNLGKESYRITISNGGNTQFTFKVETTSEWIEISSNQGMVVDDKEIFISINWNILSERKEGIVTVTGNGQKVDIKVVAEVVDISEYKEMTFLGKDNTISIEAEHTFNRVANSNAEWKVIEDYGRTLSSLKMYPTTVSFEKVEDAPYLEYRVNIDDEGIYELTVFTAPSNNLSVKGRLRYGISFDGVNAIIADSLQHDYAAGNYNNKHWCKGVLDNIHIMTTSHKLEKGVHILRFYGMDAGLVLQKLVLSKGLLHASYLGPQESYFKR